MSGLTAAPAPSLRALIGRAWSSRRPVWWRYALRLTRDPADAEDVVQDAVARTLRAEPELEDEDGAHHYVLAAVRTSAMRRARTRERLRRREQAVASDPVVAMTALDRVLGREREERFAAAVERVEAGLEGLPAEQRQVVELMILQEPPLRLREVAEIQDAPVSTVHSRLQSAIRKLGQLVAA